MAKSKFVWRYDRKARIWFCDTDLHVYRRDSGSFGACVHWPNGWQLLKGPSGRVRLFRSRQAAQLAAERAAKAGAK
jgi:hypothetical protein